MSLAEATRAVREAIDNGDLEALADALRERQLRIDSGDPVSAEEAENGFAALNSLARLRQQWAIESSRLSQIQAGFTVLVEPETGREYHG